MWNNNNSNNNTVNFDLKLSHFIATSAVRIICIDPCLKVQSWNIHTLIFGISIITSKKCFSPTENTGFLLIDEEIYSGFWAVIAYLKCYKTEKVTHLWIEEKGKDKLLLDVLPHTIFFYIKISIIQNTFYQSFITHTPPHTYYITLYKDITKHNRCW